MDTFFEALRYFYNDIKSSEYFYLLALAVILLSTKLLGLVTRKINLPQVVGALIAGVILGPACLGFIDSNEFIDNIAEIGVIFLMFSAGFETNIPELKKAGGPAFLIALIGVLVPLFGGFAVTMFFNTAADRVIQSMFIGVILTATSVSITVESLKELGRLNSRAGNAILGAAIIDDVLGIIGLTIITSLRDSTVNIAVVLIKIVAFFIVCGGLAVLFHYFYKKWNDRLNHDVRRYIIACLFFCLSLAFIAEYFFGVANITGAYVAGLAIANTPSRQYIEKRVDTISYAFFSPVFFASIGLKVTLTGMASEIWIFAVLLLLVAIISKIIGCGLGAKICKYTNKESVQIGVGMISRGEVALIVANKGASLGLMSEKMFGPVVIVVIVTTIITPILLKLAYRGDPPTNEQTASGAAAEAEDY